MAAIDDAVRRLLGPDATGELATAVRSALVAARAVVADALDSGVNDPRGDARALLVWLSAAIGESDAVAGMVGEAPEWPQLAAGSECSAPSAGSGSLARTAPSSQGGFAEPAVTEAAAAEPFDRVLDAFYADAEVQQALGLDGRAVPVGDGGPVLVAFRRAQLQILRLPDEVAREWRSRLLSLPALPGPRVEAASWSRLRADVEEELVRPGQAGEPGLCAAPNAPLDPQIAALLPCGAEAEDGTLARLAPIVSNLLTAADLDPQLRLCLEAVSPRDFPPLDSSARDRLRTELIARMREHRDEADPYSPAGVRTLLLIDEAVHGVAHLPVAGTSGWWGRTQRSARAIVEEHVREAGRRGTSVRCLRLDNEYSVASARTRDNDLKVDRGGTPGHVVLCLRMWSEVAGQQIPGRVIFRART